MTSASRDKKKRQRSTGIGFLSIRAVLLAVTVVLSLPAYSVAPTGTPLQLSNDDKTEVMAKINELRADKAALMMDCIRFWNHSMAAYAQTVANNCSSIAPDNAKYPLAISAAETEKTDDAFKSIDSIGDWYNAKSKNCDSGGTEVFSTEQCQNFRQVADFENLPGSVYSIKYDACHMKLGQRKKLSSYGRFLQYHIFRCLNMNKSTLEPNNQTNFFAFYRYEAHEVGCAKSKCDKITPEDPGNAQPLTGPYLWVCAFTSRAPSQLLPYIGLPVGVPNCEICSYQKSVCGALTNNLCCDEQYDNFVIPDDSKQEPTDPSKDNEKPPDDNASKNSTVQPDNKPGSNNSSKDNDSLANVHANIILYKDNVLGKTIMAFEGLNNTFPASISLEPTRYKRTGPIGSIVKNGSSLPGCKTLEPIHQLYSEVMAETIYVANETQINNLVSRLGYQDKGIIGQTVSQLRQCNATKVVITCYGTNGFEIRVTNTTDTTTIWEQLFPKYRFIRINFIAWDPQGNSSESSEPKANLYPYELPLLRRDDGSLIPYPWSA